MYGARDATLLVLSSRAVDQTVINALESAAQALGHETGCAVATLDEARVAAADLAEFVYAGDPWAVVAIDEAAQGELRAAFGAEADAFAPDHPVTTGAGFTLVSVPGFASCLDDLPAKRVAWGRLKAALHPGNPLG